MVVGKLTTEQKDLLISQKFIKDMHFNPIQDIDDNWCISIEEIEQYNKKKYLWIKELELIEYKSKIIKITN